VSVSFGRITQDWFPGGWPGRPEILRAAGQVGVQAVLDRHRIRDRHEAQAYGRVLVGPGDDLASRAQRTIGPGACVRNRASPGRS